MAILDPAGRWSVTRIEDVAAAAGVSVATVSRALRGLPQVSATTRATVLKHADHLGYVPSAHAAGLASGKALAISVVVPTVSGWFYASVLEGADSVLRQSDYDVALFNLGGRGGDRERVFSRSLLRRRGDAVLALCIDFDGEEREQLRSVGLPTIIVGGPVRGLRYVGIDEVDVARRATEHLIGLGHRDILHLTGGDEEGMGLNTRVPRDRHRGFQDALEAAGIPYDPTRVLPGRFSTQASRLAVDELFARGGPLPTAIFAASDEMAMGAILSIADHGLRVPDDISVIGIDDHELAESFHLTTMQQEPFRQGAIAARLLLDEIDGAPPPTRSVRMPVPLIPRRTTGPVRAGRPSTT